MIKTLSKTHKVFAEFEPNMPRVAARASVKPTKKAQSASAITIKSKRPKVF